MNDGAVQVSPDGAGVDVILTTLQRRQWVRIPVANTFSAMRLDAQETTTTDSAGNHVGLACKSTDDAYGATFSIDAFKTWRVSIDWPGGPTLIDSGQSPAIHPPGTVNALSIVCANSGGRLELMYAINGTVVADDVGSQITSQPWRPELYICSCSGTEAMTVTQLQVSTLSGRSSGPPTTVAMFQRQPDTAVLTRRGF